MMAEFKEEYRYSIYGGLTVLAPYGKYSTYKDGVICFCICGNFCIRSLHRLLIKHTGSCGCRLPTSSKFSVYEENKDEYKVFISMYKRCNYFNKVSRRSYFDKNIKLEGEWGNPDMLTAFSAFLRDMGKRPSKNHEIDRIDVDGNYSKENCRWLTRKANSLNKSNTKYIKILETNIPLKFVADLFGIHILTVRDRVFNKLPFHFVFLKSLKSNQEYKDFKKNGFRFLAYDGAFDDIIEDPDKNKKFENEFGDYVLTKYEEFINE